MSNTTKKVIKKSDWVSSFNLIGAAKITEHTFKIDEKSEKSSWIYNLLNLGIDCGEKFGTVFCEMMGGYSEEQAGLIYAHGKKEDGSDDFETQIQVAWEDRFNDEILETIGDLSFLTVGLEKTDKGSTFYKKFLAPYDAIAYIKEHLEDGMVVNVKGTLKYSSYQDKVQVRKNVTSIVLSKADDTSKYAARFTQSVLLNKDSANLKDNYDKDKGVMYVDGIVLDYLKELNGVEIKGQYPYNKQFEYEFPDISNQKQCTTIMEKLFKVKKGINQITFEGEFIEGGATVKATLDDIPEDIKDLIACGVFTEEEALAKCSSNGGREQRMILRRPMVKLTGDDKIPVVQKFEERFQEDDLVLDYLNEAVEQNVANAMNTPEADTSATTDGGSSADMDWLNNL